MLAYGRSNVFSRTHKVLIFRMLGRLICMKIISLTIIWSWDASEEKNSIKKRISGCKNFSSVFKLYCTCRMTYRKSKEMGLMLAECEQCEQWFHQKCEKNTRTRFLILENHGFALNVDKQYNLSWVLWLVYLSKFVSLLASVEGTVYLLHLRKNSLWQKWTVFNCYL